MDLIQIGLTMFLFIGISGMIYLHIEQNRNIKGLVKGKDTYWEQIKTMRKARYLGILLNIIIWHLLLYAVILRWFL